MIQRLRIAGDTTINLTTVPCECEQGRRLCGSCSGTGESRGGALRCHACRGKGDVPCIECGGRGFFESLVMEDAGDDSL